MFERSGDFPPPHGCTIAVACREDEIVLGAIFYLWPVVGSCGLLYAVTRGPRKDFVLHCAAWAATGLTVAVAGCIGLWCVAGGWGPPAPVCFGVFGLVGGVLRGVASFPYSGGQSTAASPE